MRTIGLLCVPTNSAGTISGVARAPTTLREVGLVDALLHHTNVHDYGDVVLPDPSPERDPVTHLIDHHGLIALVTRVRDAVASILDNGHFPLVIGGDCPLLVFHQAQQLTPRKPVKQHWPVPALLSTIVLSTT